MKKIYILLVVFIALGAFSLITHAQEPNVILQPADDSNSYEVDIEHNDVYWVTGTKNSDGAHTDIEYDDLGNMTRKISYPAAVTNQTPIQFFCSGPIHYNQAEYFFTASYLDVSKIPKDCPHTNETPKPPIVKPVATPMMVKQKDEVEKNEESTSETADLEKQQEDGHESKTERQPFGYSLHLGGSRTNILPRILNFLSLMFSL